MVDNIHWLPRTVGPGLRAYYEELLRQPLPQRLVDLCAQIEGGPPDDGSPPSETPPEPPPKPPKPPKPSSAAAPLDVLRDGERP